MFMHDVLAVDSFPECPEDHEMTYRWKMKKLFSGIFWTDNKVA